MAHNGAVPLRAQARDGLACECKKEGYGYVTKNVTQRDFVYVTIKSHREDWSIRHKTAAGRM